MQFPNQQDQAVQQNVQGCGDRIAAVEIQPDKKKHYVSVDRHVLLF
jgi:hypothetical protein